jgi:molecular chaperone GrpE
MSGDTTNPNSNSAANSESGAAATEQAPDNLLDQLRGDLEAAKDRVLRSQAELENYRKRAAREIEDNRRYADLALIRDLLPVLDNTERAIDAAEKSHDVAVLLEGIKLVARQFEEILGQHHCQRIGALHLPFDPHLHHAISQQPSSEYPPNTVVLVAQPGFQLYDRVVRPSQVIVSRAPDAEGK